MLEPEFGRLWGICWIETKITFWDNVKYYVRKYTRYWCPWYWKCEIEEVWYDGWQYRRDDPSLRNPDLGGDSDMT